VLRLGVAKRPGIGYEQVRARKPDIVYLSVSAFGYGGLWQYRSGYEPNAPLITGMQARMGGSADRPSGQPFAVNDQGAEDVHQRYAPLQERRYGHRP
jgi:crotonobetainyl-CoA:carnitine CoA-transferase CaiB-like acyl-CoA transferase